MIDDDLNKLLFGYTYTSPWKRKYAWFPILHDDWSITWLKWYKKRFVINKKGFYARSNTPSCKTQYLIDR